MSKPRPTPVLAVALSLTLIPLAVFAATRLPQAAPRAAPTGASPKAYAIFQNPSTGSSSISVIDTASNTTIATVTPTAAASGLAITPDARYVLVLEPAALVGAAFGTSVSFPRQTLPPTPRLEVLDTSSNTFVGAVGVGPSPVALAIAPDGLTAYVVGSQCVTQCAIFVTPVSIGPGPTLKEGTALPVPNGNIPMDIAVSPDAKTLYVLTNDGWLDALALHPGGNSTPVALDSGAHSLVLAPDGKNAYVSIPGNVNQSIPINPAIDDITLGVSPTVSSVLLPAPVGFHAPSGLAIATAPDGTSTLWVGDPQHSPVTSIALPIGTNPVMSTVDLINAEANSNALFATPDGGQLWLTTTFPYLVFHFPTPKGPLDTCYQKPGGCPSGSGPIVITPDQRPVASFAATPAGPGQPTSFDASASSIAFGSIANYHWDFGDGFSQDTKVPSATHVYTAAGTYTVALTETDWAGTSDSTSPPSTIFTGQTMTRRGGPEARATRQLTVPKTPTTPSPSASPTPTTTSVPGYTPSITLLPKVGPPGTVVAVSGRGFPPNTALTLTWLPGIGTAAVTTSGTGTFTNRFVLVFPKDRLGDRLMMARPFNVTTTMLVVPPPLAPGSHDLLLLFGR